MISHIARRKYLVADVGVAAKRSYPVLVGSIAFALTMSMLMPFIPILIGTVSPAAIDRSLSYCCQASAVQQVA